MQTQENEAVVKRFFLALDTLKDSAIIHGVSNFTDAHDINRRNLYQLRREPSRKILQVCWLTYLVNDYGISARWLLTGAGPMFDSRR